MKQNQLSQTIKYLSGSVLQGAGVLAPKPAGARAQRAFETLAHHESYTRPVELLQDPRSFSGAQEQGNPPSHLPRRDRMESRESHSNDVPGYRRDDLPGTHEGEPVRAAWNRAEAESLPAIR